MLPQRCAGATLPVIPARALAILAAALLAAGPSAVASAAPSGPVAFGDWQAAALHLPQAWQVTTGSANAIVAVVDTGVAADHPALQGRVLTGYDALDGSTNTADDNGHGTALAGIVAGTCPGCRILPVKVLAGNGTGDWGSIAAGVTWAADHGAQVIDLSVGGAHALDVLGTAVAHALSRGVIVVAAAGNDGRNESFYPAAYPGVVSVAGIDAAGARYPWSDFGSWVTVAAPGCATTTWPGNGWKSDFCGTSTAAPFVAGLAGLARSLRPTLAPADFAAALRSSAAPLADAGVASAGVPDANRLLLALDGPTGPPVSTAPPRLSAAPRVGRRLAVVDTWRDAAVVTVVWQRSRDGVAWRNVASGPTYRPVRADSGARLRAVVTGTNVRGSATAVSAPSARVGPPARRAHSQPKG